jgi:uncharacterized protein (DUF488 family)
VTEIFSIGYETHTPQSFFARLKREGVECLIDVRNVAASRKPGFNKKALAAASEEHGIVYVHLQKLGNPKIIRDQIKKKKLSVEDWKQKYADYLASVPEELEGLIKLLRERKSCLMCLEHSHTLCHRDIIIQALTVRMQKAKIVFIE